MRMIIATLALLISTGPASSQTEKLNFRTLALPNSKLVELWAIDSGKAVPLAFSHSQPSAPLKADKTVPFKIFKGPMDEDGKPADPAPTTVALPDSASVLLLGWIENENPAFLAIPDPFATAKSDDWLVINRSNKSLTLQIGPAAPPVSLEPESHQIIKCTAPIGEGAATTIASKQEDGSMKTVYSSYLPIYDDKRGLILVVQKGERVSVNYIADPVPGKAAPKKR